MTNTARKKDPQKVREDLLAAAGAFIAVHGVAALTLEGVARDAGVSKGGLLHHFPSRQALINAVCSDALARWEEAIAGYMASDPVPAGRFTRAYIRSAVTDGVFLDNRLMGALAMAMNADDALRRVWITWLDAQVSSGKEEGTAARCLARAAADGLWLAAYTGTDTCAAPMREELIARLLALSE